MTDSTAKNESRAFLIGGGISSLAAAVFLIRDANMAGNRITIFESGSSLDGSLDAYGSAETGYVVRGGRMFESKYRCTYDLFSSIPTLDKSKTVTDEITAWNQTMKTCSKSRLFRGGRPQNAPSFNLTEKQIVALEWLGVAPDWVLGNSSISDHFDPAFFESDFWLMWCTTFSFQPWHSAIELKRYLLRFMHMVSGFNTLNGIMGTVYNQFDSMIRPLQSWLEEHGVHFARNTTITDLSFLHDAEGYRVESIRYWRDDRVDTIRIKETDYVFVTLGSMTESSSLGSMKTAPELAVAKTNGAWALWKKIASKSPHFGRPGIFTDHVDQSKWVSFTTTLHDKILFDQIRNLTGNVPGEGGLITFPESSWLMSIVLPNQPHFAGQPEDVQVFWGYGLFVDKPGDYVNKPMSECNGREIMTELLFHLGLLPELNTIMDRSNCIPCMLPFITSQFLCRSKGDRPEVVPTRSRNLAFMGQFCELPDDVVFTVEYSVRSAQSAVYQLLKVDRTPPCVYQGKYDPRVVLRASLALHDAQV